MSKVIDIEDRLKLEQKKKARVDKAKKTEAVRKVVQCTRCMARCARCGVQFDTTESCRDRCPRVAMSVLTPSCRPDTAETPTRRLDGLALSLRASSAPAVTGD